MPFEMFQRFGDWFEQRAEYRKQALASLRKREGLPASKRLVGAFYQRKDRAFYPEPPGREVFLDTAMYPNGRGGYSQFAKGKQEQPSIWVPAERGKGLGAYIPTHEVEALWGQESGFEIPEVAEDGRLLANELRDLDRDAAGMELGGRVSHGRESEPVPDLVLADTSDEEVDARLQDYLKRGKQ
jgi:hypothetical protein